MKNQPQESKYKLKRSVYVGIAFLILVVIGAGCATSTPPPEQGQYIKVQVGQNTVSVPWPNNQAPQASNQVTMQQIVDWTKQGVSSDEIISRIKTANPRYSLTADDIGYLKRQGVSQRVIETMQDYK
ncbi:MAG: hypothetical protein ABSB18_07095 [Candidatus Omnitrophota bacterium]